MPQIVLEERTAHLASYTFLLETLIKLKNVTFTVLPTTKNTFFRRTHITSYFRPVNIAKFLYTSRSSRLQMFLKVSQTSQESTCVGVFFKKNLQAQGLQLY